MPAGLRRPTELAWLVLVAATLLSLWLGTDHGFSDPTAAAAVLLGVAFAKVYLIGSRFMELHDADPRLRMAFRAYVAVAGGGLIVLLLVL